MEARNPQITKHLQREDVQKRILQSMEYARAEATVTISNAAHLFGFTENQLRDWDEKGLLKPPRSSHEPTHDGKSTKRRQYTPTELNKLAIIRELINEGFTPGTIPPDVDEIWSSIIASNEQQVQGLKINRTEGEHLHLDERVERAREELFWRYYTSHVLQLSLMLICEDIPFTIAALVLPLHVKNASLSVRSTEELQNAGESLIGWLGRSKSVYTFLDPAPSVEHPSDYRVLPLQAMFENAPYEEDPAKDSTLIILERRARLTISAEIAETVRRLLAPLYEEIGDWHSYFLPGPRDLTYPATDFESSTNPADRILNCLANMVVRLGGRTEDKDRWRFCCILLPTNPLLPLQRRSLVVRAQSTGAPHKMGETTLSPNVSTISLTLRAFQSGHIIYRAEVPEDDPSVALRELEEPIRSAIAIPVGGEGGQSVAVIYIASDEPAAFPEEDQRVLRMIGRMVEELLRTYRARQQVTEKLGKLITKPRVVDHLFEDFLSENEFIRDLDDLLTRLKAQLGEWKEPKQREEVPLDERKARYKAEELTGEVVSIIAVDIDNQSSRAIKYGDQVARNLSKEVGLRICGQQGLFENPQNRRLYHIYADRFYLFLKGMAVDEARNRAEQLRVALEGEYRVEAQRVSAERLMLPERMLEIHDVTVRLGVTAYTYRKLEEILQRYPAAMAVSEVRAEIMRALDGVLNLGQKEGGNVTMSWDVDSWGYTRWPPFK